MVFMQRIAAPSRVVSALFSRFSSLGRTPMEFDGTWFGDEDQRTNAIKIDVYKGTSSNIITYSTFDNRGTRLGGPIVLFDPRINKRAISIIIIT